MGSLESDIVIAVTLARKAELFLAFLGATGDGLGKKITSIKSKLSALSPRLLGELQLFNSARNDLVHAKPSNTKLPEPFPLFCSKLDLDIDYYASQAGMTLPASAHDTQSRSDDLRRNQSAGQNFSQSPTTVEVEILPPDDVHPEQGTELVRFDTPPRSILVDESGLGDFDTIQDAIKYARDGDHIRILPGIYNGSIKIDKHIVIEGQGNRDAVIISATEDILNISGSGAKISRCTFKSAVPRVFGIVVANLSLVIIEECNFAIEEGTGVIALDGSSMRIQGCQIEHCLHGLRAAGAALEIFQTHFSHNTNGILLQEDGTAKVYNNDFVNNGTGVEVQNGARAEISGNRFNGGSAGIVADENAEGSAQSNIFTGLPADAAIFCPSGVSRLTSLQNVIT